MRQKLNQLPPPPRRSTLAAKDWLGAAVVFLAVFLSTFPVAIPFLFISNVRLALRLSNTVAVVHAVFDRICIRNLRGSSSLENGALR